MARNAHIKHTVDFILWYIVCMCVIQLTWCQAFEGVILHHAKALVIHRSWNPQNPLDFTKPTKSHENPTRPHGFPREPTKPLKHWFYIPRKMCFSPGWKTHGIPRKPTESHENPQNPTIVDFILRFSPGEKHTKTYGIPRTPTESHETPRNPTIMDFICLYIILYDGGRAFQLRLNMFLCGVSTRSQPHAHTWCRAAYRNTIQNPGNIDPGNINSAQFGMFRICLLYTSPSPRD